MRNINVTLYLPVLLKHYSLGQLSHLNEMFCTRNSHISRARTTGKICDQYFKSMSLRAKLQLLQNVGSHFVTVRDRLSKTRPCYESSRHCVAVGQVANVKPLQVSLHPGRHSDTRLQLDHFHLLLVGLLDKSRWCILTKRFATTLTNIIGICFLAHSAIPSHLFCQHVC